LDTKLRGLVSISAALLIFFLGALKLCRAEESSLAIVDSGVQPSEDAPYVSRDYRFLPGDYLYFTFQISGFAIRSEEPDEVQKISLGYEVTPQDANGVALAPPTSGTIRTELNPEDKHWMPKRQVSFLIPSFVAPGEFRVHIQVKDLMANSETAREFPFYIGGTQIKPSSSITVENFRFLRNENDPEALEVPAYSPGDTVYARFDMVGFKIDSQNHYRLSYGLTVLRPDGTPFLQEPKAAELDANSFYPAQYLPGVVKLKTSSTTSRGGYIVVLTVRDELAGTTSQIRRAFSIE
jgi:hypothetical protein